MKKTIALLALVLALMLTVTACGIDPKDPWSDAKYTKDTTLGEGSRTVTVEVSVGEHLVTFTLKTDATMLGTALLETGLCQGEDGPYGLYIKTTNGILADYDVNQHYWSLSKSGTPLMTGADSESISGGEHYEITRAK